jgi:hypothetical protein
MQIESTPNVMDFVIFFQSSPGMYSSALRERMIAPEFSLQVMIALIHLNKYRE